jgi:hypothetical protein
LLQLKQEICAQFLMSSEQVEHRATMLVHETPAAAQDSFIRGFGLNSEIILLDRTVH